MCGHTLPLLSWIKHEEVWTIYARNTCGSIQLHASVCVSVFISNPVPVSPLHIEILKLFCHFVLYWHSLALQSYLNERLDFGGETRFISFILSVRRSSSAPCSPSRDKQLTFGMTHSTLISVKYSTVPLFEGVNLISEGISHLAIIFWTIKPISEE